jgi:hypothetical protein
MADIDLPDFDSPSEDNNHVPTNPKMALKSTTGHTGIHITGFKDFLLLPELNRAIADAAFEHPSEV